MVPGITSLFLILPRLLPGRKGSPLDPTVSQVHLSQNCSGPTESAAAHLSQQLGPDAARIKASAASARPGSLCSALPSVGSRKSAPERKPRPRATGRGSLCASFWQGPPVHVPWRSTSGNSCLVLSHFTVAFSWRASWFLVNCGDWRQKSASVFFVAEQYSMVAVFGR